MKKYLSFFILWFAFLHVSSQTQTITLNFVAMDSITHDPLNIERVFIHNISADCDTVLYGTAPSLVLPNPSGLYDRIGKGEELFSIISVVPNPFNGKNMVSIRVRESLPLNLTLLDASGKQITSCQEYAGRGLNRFEIETTVRGVLFFHVSAGNFSRTVKMINCSDGPGFSRISYAGVGIEEAKSKEVISGFVFHPGDQLSFRSVTISYYDEIVYDAPIKDTTYIFYLSLVPVAPVVVSDTVLDITSATATTKGIVTFDGGAPVTARGFCWSTDPIPDLNDPHTSDGSGTGLFLSYITGLVPDTDYYTCAYAINSVDTSYGEVLGFRTLRELPEVVTSKVYNISPSGAYSGGNVLTEGGDSVTARGFCYAAAPNPVITGPHTTDGSGTGVFTSIMTGLIPDQTYYGRAYATNSFGTSYGEELSFSTPGDGFYIRGEATAYNEFNDNAMMKITRNEVIQTEDPNILELYIPVMAGSGGFNIVRVSGYSMTIYGPGSDFTTIYTGGPEEPKVPFQRGSFIEDTVKFTVPADGMYHVAIYIPTQRAVVVPVHWGMVGSALKGWNESVPLDESPYDSIAMAWTNDSIKLYAGEWKFRYSDGWKVELDTTVYVLPGIKGVKVNANFGNTVEDLVPGGSNIVNTEAGTYACTMNYSLGAGYQATLIKTGPLPPTDWTNVVCDAVGSGISSDNPEAAADTSSWHWGNQLLADNEGIPAEQDNIYTWTWTNVILEAFAGFKVRTLNGLPSPINGRSIIGGYSDLNIEASAPEIISDGGPNGNLMATVKGSYTITLHVDAANNDQEEIIIVKN